MTCRRECRPRHQMMNLRSAQHLKRRTNTHALQQRLAHTPIGVHTHVVILLRTKEHGSGGERRRGQGSFFHLDFSILPLRLPLNYSLAHSIFLSFTPFDLCLYVKLPENSPHSWSESNWSGGGMLTQSHTSHRWNVQTVTTKVTCLMPFITVSLFLAVTVSSSASLYH